MVDLASEMAQLWTSLGAPIPGHGRVLSFVAASQGEGASTIAREFASFAAERVKRNVWLVDLDVPGSAQMRAFVEEQDRYGVLGREAAGSPDGSTFFTVQPPMRGADGRPWPPGRYLAAQQLAKRRLWVTRFRRELLRQGQSVQVTAGGPYWSALRQHSDLVVVDCPAAMMASLMAPARVTSRRSAATTRTVMSMKGAMVRAARDRLAAGQSTTTRSECWRSADQ